MNWLTNFVRPKIRALVRKNDVPDNLWRQCPGCEQMIFHRDLERNLHVCPSCGHHMRMAAQARINLTIDAEEEDRLELSLDVCEASLERIARERPDW